MYKTDTVWKYLNKTVPVFASEKTNCLSPNGVEEGGEEEMSENIFFRACASPTLAPALAHRTWKSLNSHAFGPLDTDQYARHIPVGRVCAERTSRAPLTETDMGNMYCGSFVFVPGPCAYGGERYERMHAVICHQQILFPTGW